MSRSHHEMNHHSEAQSLLKAELEAVALCMKFLFDSLRWGM